MKPDFVDAPKDQRTAFLEAQDRGVTILRVDSEGNASGPLADKLRAEGRRAGLEEADTACEAELSEWREGTFERAACRGAIRKAQERIRALLDKEKTDDG